MSRTIYSWGQFEQLAKNLGLKFTNSNSHIDENKRKAQKEKFCKCKNCGGQCDYIKGTNCLICNCIVEKEKKVITKDKYGKVTSEKSVKILEPCGTIDVVPVKYQDYMKYLFE